MVSEKKITATEVFFFFFWCWPFLKILLNLLQYCFFFFLMFWFFWPQGMWDLSSTPPALEGKVLTTTLPGKSLLQRFLGKHHMYRVFCILSHLLALRDLEQCLTYQYIIGEWMKLKEKELLFNGNYCLLERMPSPSLRIIKDKLNLHLS